MKRKVLTIYFLLLALLSSLQLSAQQETKEITLDDIFLKGTFRPRLVYGIQAMNNGNHYCILEKDSLNVYEYKTGNFVKTLVTENELVPEGDTTPVRLSRFTFSDDEQKMLVPANTERIYRYSSRSEYYIWDFKEKKLVPLSDEGKQRLADFSPDGSKVAFVRDNNLFYKDLITGEEEQITNDGKENSIINGTTDWVYEEEFGFTKAFFWSPDGSKIAFYRFDESDVKEYSLTIWGELYPEEYTYKYPKAGEDNSIVSIHIYDVKEGNTTQVNIGEEIDIYIPRIKWSKMKDMLSVQRMNRLQNKLEILLANSNTGDAEVIYTEENNYYIDITDNLYFLDNQEQFIITSEKTGYNHIYLCNMYSNDEIQLTSGNWDVISMEGFDEKKELIYFVAAMSSPLNREIYSVDLRGKKTRLTDKEGFNSPRFNKDFTYFINTYSTINTPHYITVNKSSGKEVRVLEDNDKFINTTREYGFSEYVLFTITTSDSVELNAYKLLPANFDTTKEYPLLMYVYGGPGSQTVLNSWYSQNTWFQMLAQKGIMVVSVDNRGTGARGEEFKKMTYLQLGKYETIDQIESAKYLGNLRYVDEEHIGMFGWSYGGYMTALCMTKGSDHFNTGISVAPVTNWRYYDNIYTERFMRTPQENPDGYDDNSPINHVDKLKGNFLLIHGTGDDNVHVQNTMDLVTALVDANKQFEMQLYPNKNHGIYGGYTTYHLYKRMTEFLMENLLKK